ncbi:MAG: hypothetical protein PHP85_10475 [Gallionella sp.]|nr:hypothetical protein [Gallionella sp.]
MIALAIYGTLGHFTRCLAEKYLAEPAKKGNPVAGIHPILSFFMWEREDPFFEFYAKRARNETVDSA